VVTWQLINYVLLLKNLIQKQIKLFQKNKLKREKEKEALEKSNTVKQQAEHTKP